MDLLRKIYPDQEIEVHQDEAFFRVIPYGTATVQHCDQFYYLNETDLLQKSQEPNDKLLQHQTKCGMCGEVYDINHAGRKRSDIGKSGKWLCSGCCNKPSKILTVWVSCSELGPNDSKLAISPGSNKLTQWNSPIKNKQLPGDFDQENAKWVVSPETGMGDIVIFDFKTIHGATPNHSLPEMFRFSLDFRASLEDRKNECGSEEEEGDHDEDATETPKQIKLPKKPKDKNAPKRPQTGYFRFQNEKRKEWKHDPSIESKDVCKKASVLWSRMNTEQKKPYQQIAKQDKAKYEEILKQYKQTALYENYQKDIKKWEKQCVQIKSKYKSSLQPKQPRVINSNHNKKGRKRSDKEEMDASDHENDDEADDTEEDPHKDDVESQTSGDEAVENDKERNIDDDNEDDNDGKDDPANPAPSSVKCYDSSSKYFHHKIIDDRVIKLVHKISKLVLEDTEWHFALNCNLVAFMTPIITDIIKDNPTRDNTSLINLKDIMGIHFADRLTSDKEYRNDKNNKNNVNLWNTAMEAFLICHEDDHATLRKYGKFIKLYLEYMGKLISRKDSFRKGARDQAVSQLDYLKNWEPEDIINKKSGKATGCLDGWAELTDLITQYIRTSIILGKLIKNRQLFEDPISLNESKLRNLHKKLLTDYAQFYESDYKPLSNKWYEFYQNRAGDDDEAFYKYNCFKGPYHGPFGCPATFSNQCGIPAQQQAFTTTKLKGIFEEYANLHTKLMDAKIGRAHV